MASPWAPVPQQSRIDRPWMGIAFLAAIPFLSLILIRMLWSGSSLWFLSVGIILLGAAAVIFLARRPQGLEYARQLPVYEAQRAPLILMGIGVLFLAMLLVPNFSGGGSASQPVAQQQAANALTSDVSDVAADVVVASQPAVQEPVPAPARVEPEDETAVLGDDGTYVVLSGDTLWTIAQSFGTTVDAIIDANELDNPSELYVGDELVIPAPAEEVTQ